MLDDDESKIEYGDEFDRNKLSDDKQGDESVYVVTDIFKNLEQRNLGKD